jgi:hypothetical protein
MRAIRYQHRREPDDPQEAQLRRVPQQTGDAALLEAPLPPLVVVAGLLIGKVSKPIPRSR